MTAPPLSSWIRIFRPSGTSEVYLGVITGYFDDSGTHSGATVVVWAGFIGPEERWIALDEQWREVLSREGLQSFHMTDCEAREGEFRDFKKADCDKTIHDLRAAIKDAKLVGIGMAVPLADWEVAKREHPLGSKFGTAEEAAFSGCFYHALNLAQDLRPGTDVSLVFDDRDRVTPSMSRIMDHYRGHARQNPHLASVTFQKRAKFTGLQAADLLAWETYRYATDWVAAGARPLARPHFNDLLEHPHMHGTFMDLDRIRHQFANARIRED